MFYKWNTGKCFIQTVGDKVESLKVCGVDRRVDRELLDQFLSLGRGISKTKSFNQPHLESLDIKILEKVH